MKVKLTSHDIQLSLEKNSVIMLWRDKQGTYRSRAVKLGKTIERDVRLLAEAFIRNYRRQK